MDPPRRGGIDAVQPRQRHVHGVEMLGPGFGGDAGKGGVPKNAAGHHVHDVEPGADHFRVLAERVDGGNGETQGPEAAEHLRFAVDGVRPLEERSHGLPAQHIDAGRRDQLERGIRLTADELLHPHGAVEIADMLRHPFLQATLVEPVARAHRRALPARRVGHACAARPRMSRLIFFASDHLCTSVGPS